HLAPDDRMYARALRRVIKLDRAEEVAVIGHGDRRHLLLDRDLHQLVDIAGSVEQRVVGVAVQVDEGHRWRTFLGRRASILADAPVLGRGASAGSVRVRVAGSSPCWTGWPEAE